jgi:Transposase zinc-binding domain
MLEITNKAHRRLSSGKGGTRAAEYDKTICFTSPNEHGKKLVITTYTSCGNRHCPKCPGRAPAAWLAARDAELLDVPYVHVVFTRITSKIRG